MRSHIRIISAAAALMLALCSVLPQVTRADTEETIQKEYEFTAQDKDNLHYPALEEITEAGVTYRLKDISYEIIEEAEPISIVRKVITDNTEDYPKTVKKEINGDTYMPFQELSTRRNCIFAWSVRFVKAVFGMEIVA